MLRRGEITIDKRARRNGTKRYPPPEARIKINSRGSSFSLHRSTRWREREREGKEKSTTTLSLSPSLSRPRLNYPNHLSTTTWRFKLINSAFWIVSNLRACTGCVITCSHEPAFMLTLVMHYVINAQHRAQETPTVLVPVARCFMEYARPSPFLFLFFLFSLSLSFSPRVRLCTRNSTKRTSWNTRRDPEFERAVHAFYFSPLTEHRLDRIECRRGRGW